jgi:hypothetical protein
MPSARFFVPPGSITGDFPGVVPVFTASITQASLEVGNNATLTVNGPVQSYQWRLNGVDISGATSASYTTTAVGSLACIVDPLGPQAPVTTAAVAVSGEFSQVVDGELVVSGAQTGELTLTIESPAHLATYDSGNGPGVYIWTPNPEAPTILYPGALTPTSPVEGSLISLLYTPLVVYMGTLSITDYEFVFDGLPSEQTGTTLPQAPEAGTVVALSYNVTDSNGTTPGITGSVTTISSGAVINSITYDAGGIIIDHTGTLSVTYDAGGINLETN